MNRSANSANKTTQMKRFSNSFASDFQSNSQSNSNSRSNEKRKSLAAVAGRKRSTCSQHLTERSDGRFSKKQSSVDKDTDADADTDANADANSVIEDSSNSGAATETADDRCMIDFGRDDRHGAAAEVGSNTNQIPENHDPDWDIGLCFNSDQRWEEFTKALLDNVYDSAIAAAEAAENEDRPGFAVPNLRAYSKAKALRKASSQRFEKAVGDFIRKLRETIQTGILSELIEPLCNRYSERLEETEENILQGMVSNHLRRKKLMKNLHRADALWKSKHETLIAELFDQPTARPTNNCSHRKETKYEDEDEDADDERNQEQPDWESLREQPHEASRERIDVFLNERQKDNQTVRAFDDFLEVTLGRLDKQIDAILDTTVSEVNYDRQQQTFASDETELQDLIIENYERRSHLQSQLEKSAQRAQGLYANLLSSLQKS